MVFLLYNKWLVHIVRKVEILSVVPDGNAIFTSCSSFSVSEILVLYPLSNCIESYVT